MTRHKTRPARGQRALFEGMTACLGCGRWLRSERAARRGYGRRCWRRARAERSMDDKNLQQSNKEDRSVKGPRDVGKWLIECLQNDLERLPEVDPEYSSAEAVRLLQDIAKTAAHLCVCAQPGALTGDAHKRLCTLSQLLHHAGMLEERFLFPRKERQGGSS